MSEKPKPLPPGAFLEIARRTHSARGINGHSDRENLDQMYWDIQAMLEHFEATQAPLALRLAKAVERIEELERENDKLRREKMDLLLA